MASVSPGQKGITGNPEASPFSRRVRYHFDAFEQVYAIRFQPEQDFWRPVICTAIDKFRKLFDPGKIKFPVSQQSNFPVANPTSPLPGSSHTGSARPIILKSCSPSIETIDSPTSSPPDRW